MKVTYTQVAILAIMVAGIVVLTLENKDVSVYVSLFSPILSALFIVGHLSTQDQTLNQIQQNTNGVLTQRIKDAVQEALAQNTVDEQVPQPVAPE